MSTGFYTCTKRGSGYGKKHIRKGADNIKGIERKDLESMTEYLSPNSLYDIWRYHKGGKDLSKM